MKLRMGTRLECSRSKFLDDSGLSASRRSSGAMR